jgi:cell division protein FtsW
MARIQAPKPKGRPRINLLALGSRIFGHQSRNFYWIFGTSLFIVVFGMAMVLSSSSVDSLTTYNNPYYVFFRQLAFGAIGFAGMLFISILPLDKIMSWGRIFFVGGLAAQLLVFGPLGVSVGGNRNWIKILGVTFQPSEFIKLGLILVLAERLAKQEFRMHDIREFLYRSWAYLVVPAVVLVVLGNDLGTTLIIALIAFGVTWMTGIPTKYLRGVAALAVIAVFFMVQFGSSRSGRINAWISQGSDDSSTYAWQSQHGIWALAAGSFSGVGLGNSKLKWSWIPEVDNDYIFAIIGEETGLIGAAITIGLFLLLVILIRRTLIRASNSYIRNASAGIMIWIGFQSLVNVSVVVQNLPVLGVPLPLVSSGGSSLISAMFAIGVMLAFERHMHQEELMGGARVTPLERARNRRMARQ